MSVWGKLFKHQGIDMWWGERSPLEIRQRCDRVPGHWVEKDEPRLRVSTNRGKDRASGHSRKHEYICLVCALKDYGLHPFDKNQEQLFA